jgi:threonine aldolase
MRERGVLANASDPTTLRLVTHLDVTRAEVETAAEVICELLT